MYQRERDEKYMHRCIQLALNGRQNARPNPMVGAVIVLEREDRILGEGYHVRCGEGHAEVNAFASVRPEDESLLRDATVYVSLEPCAHYGKTPPCCDLIISKGVRRVVVGCIDPFAQVQGRGIGRIREAGIEVTVGVLQRECEWLNRRFFTFHREHRPYVILKWAQSSDGYLDFRGRQVAISTPFTKMLVHQLRAEEDAIVVGRVTEEREHPQLTVREWSGPSPVKYVLSKKCKVKQILQDCYERNLQSLIVEGGASTHEAFISKNCWDEIRVETSPRYFGWGTAAVGIPYSARMYRRELVDGNEIVCYRRRPFSGCDF